jgi:hypothetical protein
MSTADRVLAYLQNHHMKPTGTNEYIANRPWSVDSNSMGLSLKIDGPEHGTYYDHVAKEGGSLYELAQKLGITMNGNGPTPTPVSPQPSPTSLYDYAQRHGVDVDVFTSAGWVEETKDGRDCLRFTTRNGDRFRFLDDQKPKFKSPMGYKSCWYGLDKAISVAEKEGKPLVITGGEPSVVSAQHFGIPACSMTGGERASIPDDLLQELRQKWTGQILLTCDCDDTGKLMSDGLTQQLMSQGYTVFSLDLNGGDKFDLGDFCALHGSDSATALYELNIFPPPAQPKQRITIIQASEALEPQEPIKWIVDSLIAEETVTLLVGEPGSKKTYAATEMGVNVSQGRDFIGKKTLPVNVLYIDEEMGEREMKRRLGAVMRGNFSPPDIPLSFISLARFDLRVPGDVALLSTAILDYKAGLVIIDTLANVMPGADENSVKDVQPVFMALRKIAVDTSCAVVVIHHTNKAGGYRGSSAMKGEVDLMLMVESAPDSEFVKFRSEKSRFAPPSAFTGRIHFSESQVWFTEEETKMSGPAFSVGEKYVLETLLQNGDEKITTIRDNAEPTCSGQTARTAVYGLKGKGLLQEISKDGKEVTVGLTDKGSETAKKLFEVSKGEN